LKPLSLKRRKSAVSFSAAVTLLPRFALLLLRALLCPSLTSRATFSTDKSSSLCTLERYSLRSGAQDGRNRRRFLRFKAGDRPLEEHCGLGGLRIERRLQHGHLRFQRLRLCFGRASPPLARHNLLFQLGHAHAQLHDAVHFLRRVRDILAGLN